MSQREVRRGVEAVEAMMARCNVRLAQIDQEVATSTFGPVALVDVEYLVRAVIEAAHGSGVGDE